MRRSLTARRCPRVEPQDGIWRDAESAQIYGGLDEITPTLLAKMVYAIASANVDEEARAVRDRPRTAYESVGAREPVAYKVVSPRREDYVDVYGAIHIHFVGGVAYLSPEREDIVDYYRRTYAYEVVLAYGIPTRHAEAERQSAAQAAQGVRIGTPTQDGRAHGQ